MKMIKKRRVLKSLQKNVLIKC